MYLTITLTVGVCAALLMFCGDMLLYFTTDDFKTDGTLAPYYEIMKKLPISRLKLGGLLGPIAAFLYCIGYCHIILVTVEEYRIAALLATLICSLGIIIGGAYHSHFTCLGLISKTKNKEGLQMISKNVKLLSSFSITLIAIGLLIMAALIVLNKTGYPPWFVILTPVVTYFLNFLWAKLPQPFRVVLSGGWYNLMFVIYFGFSLIII